MADKLMTHKEDPPQYIKRQMREEVRKLIEGKKSCTLPGAIGVAANVADCAIRNVLSSDPKVRDDEKYGCGNETRIVLIGKTGWGKSATGNTIIGDEQFVSYTSPTSITTKCKSVAKMRNREQVLVIDTPGIFDTKVCEKETGMLERRKLEKELLHELLKWLAISSPGPHAILIVLSVKTRQTGQEIATMQRILSHFGKDIFRYMIVVFTGCDELERQGTSFEHYIQALHKIDFFKEFLGECDNRQIAFKNIPVAGQEQVTKLFEMIEKMKTKNEVPYFRNTVINNIEKEIRRRIDRAIERENTRMLDQSARREIRQEIREEIEREGPLFDYFVECAVDIAAFALASAIAGLCISLVPAPLGLAAAVTTYVTTHCCLQ